MPVALTSAATMDQSLAVEAKRFTDIAAEMRADMQHSLEITLKAMSPEMKSAGISPFTPEDTRRDPKYLLSYENHRFMQDWFLADWGDRALDLGHLKHRSVAGMQRVGLHMDGVEQLQPTLGLRWLLCYEESDAESVICGRLRPSTGSSRVNAYPVEHCPGLS